MLSPFSFLNKKTILGNGFFLFLCVAGLGADAELKLEQDVPLQAVFVNNGKEFYVIPTLVVAPNGDVLAIVERRMGGRADDAEINLSMKRSADNGKTWGDLSLIYQDGKNSVTCPCPVVDTESGVIWLFFSINNKSLWLTSSKDNGATWAKPEPLKVIDPRQHQYYANGPGHGIQIKNGPHKGRLLIPSYSRYDATADYKAGSKSYVIYSDDHGHSWKIGEPTVEGTPDGPDGNECMIAELDGGKLYMTIRNNMAINGNRAAARSSDGGVTWSKIFLQPDLPEPICEGSVLSVPLSSGRLITLYTGPSIKAAARMDKSARRAISMWASQDDGATWKLLKQIYDQESAYSDMTLMRNGAIGVLYWVWNKDKVNEKLVFESFKLIEQK